MKHNPYIAESSKWKDFFGSQNQKCRGAPYLKTAKDIWIVIHEFEYPYKTGRGRVVGTEQHQTNIVNYHVIADFFNLFSSLFIIPSC